MAKAKYVEIKKMKFNPINFILGFVNLCAAGLIMHAYNPSDYNIAIALFFGSVVLGLLVFGFFKSGTILEYEYEKLYVKS